MTAAGACLLPPLIPAVLIRRYQRFLADFALESGEIVTAHCPNSGSMKGCAVPGSPAFLSRCDKPGRKLCYTWELVRADGCWVGINTGLPNRLVHKAIECGVVTELQGYEAIRPEVPYGTNSRIDLLLTRGDERCYVEVKNVTLMEDGRALFPDAATVRGQKHLRELMEMVRLGHRAVNFFVVQRPDCNSVSPADAIDPEYGRLLRLAAAAGVELLAYQAQVGEETIYLQRPLVVQL
ncbi:DNA/RNA nuclease SfsA [Geotalea sp. SG265]|uniref:DNA/RNA nuclease SfsA n=1 Tax=Geotalea sp. SG265 TaxID=2922867 RepID=UPI001FAF38B7|nr:DNA/RNA nuclease SfsA [Geotalea sp. SG265]